MSNHAPHMAERMQRVSIAERDKATERKVGFNSALAAGFDNTLKVNIRKTYEIIAANVMNNAFNTTSIESSPSSGVSLNSIVHPQGRKKVKHNLDESSLVHTEETVEDKMAVGDWPAHNNISHKQIQMHQQVWAAQQAGQNLQAIIYRNQWRQESLYSHNIGELQRQQAAQADRDSAARQNMHNAVVAQARAPLEVQLSQLKAENDKLVRDEAATFAKARLTENALCKEVSLLQVELEQLKLQLAEFSNQTLAASPLPGRDQTGKPLIPLNALRRQHQPIGVFVDRLGNREF